MQKNQPLRNQRNCWHKVLLHKNKIKNPNRKNRKKQRKKQKMLHFNRKNECLIKRNTKYEPLKSTQKHTNNIKETKLKI